MSIADNLQRLVTAKTNIANAITEMGGTVNTGDGFEEFPADIATIPTGGSSDKPVQFIDDADGSVVYSYTAEEFANLSAMPPNPTHEGLTSQGWNWTLSDAKTYVATCGQLCIGQSYVTDDGYTRLYITLKSTKNISLKLTLAARTNITIYWGDGSSSSMSTTSSSSSKTSTHTYSKVNSYKISLAVSQGSFSIDGTTSSTFLSQMDSITKVEIGTGLSALNGAFYKCYNLNKITIPTSVTTITDAFMDCTKLSQITLPSGYTRGNTISGLYDFGNCYSLIRCSLPKTFTFAYFDCCYVLSQISTSDGLPELNGCCSLTQITIPASVSSIGAGALAACYKLRVIKFMRQTPPVATNSNWYSGIPSHTGVKLLVPAGSLSSYTSATNYPSSSLYDYEEY